MPSYIIKVCGITNQEDAENASEAGASALGFNFYLKSPRYIPFDEANRIVSGLSNSILKVGIFVNARPDEIVAAMETIPLDVVQIHGEFNPTNHEHIWRGISAAQELPAADPTVEAYLIDTPCHEYGGSGRTFDWTLAAAFPYRKIVAGGLDAANVAEAIHAAHPWGVDACSRLEVRPGKKDSARVRAFVSAAVEAFSDVLAERSVS